MKKGGLAEAVREAAAAVRVVQILGAVAYHGDRVGQLEAVQA